MDLKILEIASHTDNNKIIEDFTHKSKHKNPLCGDEMEIRLIIKDDVSKIWVINANLVFIAKRL